MTPEDSFDAQAKPPSQQQRRDAAVERLRRELRRQIRGSDMTQRAIEEQNGFTRGYLSQVLQGHVTLTVRHVFGILMALAIPPDTFFRRFFGDSSGSSREPLSEIRERMARYDAAIRQLEDQGLLTSDSDSETDS